MAILKRFAANARIAVWAIACVATLALVVQPVGADVQLGLAISAVAVMAGLWMWASGPLARMCFLATGSLIVLRYLYWRATSTLPPLDEPISFAFAIVLFVAEMYCVIFLAINLVINADPLTRRPAAAQTDADLPSVDVLIPSYNEDEAILAVTLSAARAIDYPQGKLNVWLLDDGGTDQKCSQPDSALAAAAKTRRAALTVLCANLGVNYLARARNEHAKAGNLNAGLAASTGDIVVVLDADHVPFRSFLRETVGHFAEDPKLFLVQTPHVFLNPDPIEKNLDTFDRMPSENEMFYSITQRGLDKWNGSFFCGSAALLRRAALREAGGFAGVTITEDCETAFELHAKGWTSIYVDTPLIAGLQPETFTSFIGQRARWCQGMFQIMLLKNPILKSGLKPIQRFAYLSSMMFWMFPLPRLVFMFAPLLHIFFDVRIFTSSMDETIAYTASYVVVNVMIQSYLFGHVRWPWMSELYEYVQGIFLIRSIASVIGAPRKPVFNVTAKGQSLDQNHLSELAMPFVIVFGLLAAGVVTAGYRYLFEPGVTSLMLVVGIWASVNLVVAGAALGAVAEREQIERTPRLQIARHGLLKFAETSLQVTIDNVSADGCSIAVPADSIVWTDIAVGVAGTLTVLPFDTTGDVQTVPVNLVRMSSDLRRVGVTFDRQARSYLTALVELMYADSGAISRFLLNRRARHSFIRGTLQFARWGVEGPLRALHYWRLGRAVPSVVQTMPADLPVSVSVTAPVEIAALPVAVDAPSISTATAPVVIAPPVVRAVPSIVETTLQPAKPSAWMQAMLDMAASEIAQPQAIIPDDAARPLRVVA